MRIIFLPDHSKDFESLKGKLGHCKYIHAPSIKLMKVLTLKQTDYFSDNIIINNFWHTKIDDKNNKLLIKTMDQSII